MNLKNTLLVAAAVALSAPTVPCEASGFQVIGSLSRERNLEAGETSKGRILVHNTSSELLELEAYQTDYWFASDGRNRYDKPGTLPRSNAPWITVTPQQLRVPAGETLSFTYDIDVPDDQSLNGTYWSMVMVAPIANTVELEDSPGERKVSVQTTLRYGVQMVTDVGATASASLSVIDAQLKERETGVALNLRLKNTGERHTRPQIWLEIFDDQGASLGRWPGESKRLYPTTSASFDVPLTGLPTGHYSALMVADLGNDEVFGAQYNLDIQ